MEILLASILLGACTGAVLALTGAGGTIIAVPLLIFGLHFTVAESAPVALFAVCVSSTIGALIALRQGRVRYRAAGFIAVTGILVAPAGMWLAQKLPNAPLTVLFALILFYVAVSMLRQSMQPMAEARDAENPQTDPAAIPCRLEYERGRLIWGWPCVRALGYSGIATGFISGLLGVGGGFVVVPALKRATNLPMQSILATSLAVTAFISAVGVASATVLGTMNWPVALPFATGALAGMLIGRAIAGYLAPSRLQQGFAVVSMSIAVWMILRLFWIS